jgi:two-component system, LytTR family, response regulator
MLNAIIIEDNFRDRELLEMLLSKYCINEINILGSAENISNGFKLIIETKPDVVFLDIELGTESSFDLLAKFDEYDFKVIFVSAYDKYAMNAIKSNALDFILKPIEISELLKTVHKLVKVEKLSVDVEIKNLLYNLSNPHEKSNRIAIPFLNGYKMVPVSDIMYCEANKEYTNIHCINKSIICSSINLGEYEDMLEGYSFCRVHHSYLVNKEYVKEYLKGEGGELLMDKGNMIPVSRRKKQEVVDWLTLNR